MISDKTLVVTGATLGLSAHFFKAALRAGYRVVGLAKTVASAPAFEIWCCDVGDAGQVRDVFKRAKADKGLYALVNAAGIAFMNLVLATPSETMERIVRTNLLGTMYCSAGIVKFCPAGNLVESSTFLRLLFIWL